MGTVGLSFGSPTSGAGFDVSSTVAEIVGNLQNVESPWKNQLTSLESQDAAISNLGTLFSNLSNDMSSLTDLRGVLAQKEGSSSDTNVLELTAANSSAAAGTYTVEVQSLAQTSSGYLTAVNASYTLSGSITLQVGSGTAQTIDVPVTKGENTIAGLAAAINSSGVGVSANVVPTASGSVLSLTSGTSGAGGDLNITSNVTDAKPITLGYADTGYTSSGNQDSGSLSAVGSSDTIGGSISIAVGGGKAQVVDVPTTSGNNTLEGLADAIDNTSGIGVTASVTTSSGQSILSLVSNTTGTAGALTVASSITDSAPVLGYNSTVTGANAQLTVNGISGLTSSSNTVANLIPGVTFQLLAPSPTESNGSLEQVQVVIGNDNTDVESTVNQFVSDYNALISAVSTQEGNTSSGTPEPLFGSPTLSLLQDQLLNGLNTVNPNGYMDAVLSEGTTLSGSMTIAIGGGTAKTVEIGAAPSAADGGPAANTIYTGSGSDYNTLAGLAAAINASSTPLSYADTGYTSGTDYDTGTVGEVANTGDSLSGSLSITVGSGSTATANTVTMAEVDSAEGGTTLSDLVSYINSNSETLGVTATPVANDDGSSSLSLQSTTAGTDGALTVASGLVDGIQSSAAVSTSDGESTLSLTSQTEGSAGALAVTSAIEASTPTALGYTDNGYSSTTADNGTLGSAASSTDTLSGSITVQVGGGAAQTIDMSTVESDPAIGGATLGDLQQYIYDNSSTLGFTASIVNNSDGSQSLSLTSNTDGPTGALTVASNLYDSTSPTISTLGYTNSSDISSLTGLGISVNNDGSLTFDANSLDSILNTDYSGVVGFFQNTNSWGQAFSNMLNDAGTSSSTGILALASSSNSSIESTLNADISKEQSYISAQQSSLTTELNQANEIMQELPTQLNGINELYSAITGYDQNLD